MKRVLFVCLGNICRSPLAEGILRAKTVDKMLDLDVDSCGTGDYHVGQKPDHRSIDVARKYGIDLSQLRARQFHKGDFKAFDHIFVMDRSNYSDIADLADSEDDLKKVKLFLDYSSKYDNSDVPDPYYGGEDGFEKVYDMLDDACENFIRQI